MNVREAVIGVLCFLLALLVFFWTRDFPGFSARGAHLPGPAFFPNFIAFLLVCCGILQLVRAYREGLATKRAGKRPDSLKDTVTAFLRLPGVGTMVLTVASVVVYILVVDSVGFQLTTLALLAIMMLCFQVRPLRAVIYSIVVVAIMVVVFERLFHVPLPYGIFHL